MNYTTQTDGSPFQIQPGEAFSHYVFRMEDVTGGSFLADYAEDHVYVVDLLGAVESTVLADAIWAEMAEDQRMAWTEDSPDYMSLTQGLCDDLDYPEDGGEALDAYHHAVVRAAFEDCMTRADLMGLAEMCAPGVLVRVATRISTT